MHRPTPLTTRFCFPSHSLAPFLHPLHPQTRTHPLPRTPLHPKDPHTPTPPESLVRPLATRYERADRISFATITPSASGPLGALEVEVGPRGRHALGTLEET